MRTLFNYTAYSTTNVYICLFIQTSSCHQVHIGTALSVDVGTLRYRGTADVILGATASVIFVVVVVIATVVCLITVGCKQYKKRLSRAKAQNEQLEQEVINMESQVAMMHGQMRGNYHPFLYAHNGVNCIAVLLPPATYIVLPNYV